jgi:HAD superfamily hydrolase (TIGR01549 family)
MSRAAGKPAEWLHTWYFESYIPLMCEVLKKHDHPRPGTAELFEFLTQEDYPFAVYSDYPRTAERLSALGLNPAAGGRLYGPEHFGAQKPAVRPFLSIAQDLGVPPEQVLVVGDREDTDGAGAKAAGMAYINIASKTQDPAHSVTWEALIALLRELRPAL